MKKYFKKQNFQNPPKKKSLKISKQISRHWDLAKRLEHRRVKEKK